jgi:hypothetical protein
MLRGRNNSECCGRGAWQIMEAEMRSGDYQRLGAALAQMATHSNSSQRSRWSALAQACFDLEEKRLPAGAADNLGIPRLQVRVAGSRTGSSPLRPQLSAAQQDKTAGRTELPRRGKDEYPSTQF